MSGQIDAQRFTDSLNALLDETFERVGGIYLDEGTSLFETLAGVTAAQASRPLSSRCASIAAQVAHTTYYLDILSTYVRGQRPSDVDWSRAWQITAVDDAEWARLNDELRASYRRVRDLLAGITDWNGEEQLSGALAIVVHTAHHLGEIRQALGVLEG
jgi:hypothetical protein